MHKGFGKSFLLLSISLSLQNPPRTRARAVRESGLERLLYGTRRELTLGEYVQRSPGASMFARGHERR